MLEPPSPTMSRYRLGIALSPPLRAPADECPFLLGGDGGVAALPRLGAAEAQDVVAEGQDLALLVPIQDVLRPRGIVREEARHLGSRSEPLRVLKPADNPVGIEPSGGDPQIG